MKRIEQLLDKLFQAVNAGKWWAFLLFLLLMPAFLVLALVALVVDIFKGIFKGEKNNEKPH